MSFDLDDVNGKGRGWDVGWRVAIGVVLTMAVLWALLGWFASTRENPGLFGDMFGAANALFSGLAFAGLVYTIMLQRRELALQRQELAETRRELKAQNDHFEDQNRTLRQQATDATFFQLLRLHNDIVNAVDLSTKDGERTVARGRDCFKIFFRTFRGKFSEMTAAMHGKSEYERLQLAYMAFYQDHQSDVGHYFRSLYNIIKFVDRSNLHEKRLYTNLVRAQLSSYEQVLLFYNCISPLGEGKFKPLIEKYAFFNNLPFELLIDEQHKMYFAARAFA